MSRRPATVGEFIEQAHELGVRVIPLRFVRPGSVNEARALLRTNGGPEHHAVIPSSMRDGDRLSVTVLVSWCQQLGLPAHAFGVVIG